MKKTLLLLTAIASLIGAAIAQVTIPLDQPVVVEQPVTITQNVTVSAVPIAAITFDLTGERITFRVAGNQTTGGNNTLTVTGAEYQAIKAGFLDPFAAAVAPILRTKLSDHP